MAGRRSTLAAVLAAVLTAAPAGVAGSEAPEGAYTVIGDEIPSPLTGARGDAGRGRGLVVSRHVGLCLLCHSGPFPEERLQGTIGPDLGGTGARLSEGQIRLRIVDASRVYPVTIMPAYYRTRGLRRVAPSYRGKPVLSAEQIEDIVAFLATLRD